MTDDNEGEREAVQFEGKTLYTFAYVFLGGVLVIALSILAWCVHVFGHRG